MITQEENLELCQVGPGTSGGELLRRYWHPVCPTSELSEVRPKKRVRLLGEDLVVFQDENGYGCVEERCAHRGCSLYYGFLEDGGIRCPYHGWLYAKDGRCLEQPFEPAQSMLKHTVRQAAYPVQEARGLLFVYMGPQPAPLLPPWDVLVREDGVHHVEVHPVLDSNWLQVQETNADPAHNTFLHYKFGYLNGARSSFEFQPMELNFAICEWGLIKTRNLSDGSRDDGRIAIFPNILGPTWEYGRVLMYWRTPIDDTHTQTFGLGFNLDPDGKTALGPRVPPVNYVSYKDDDGYFHMKANPSQDAMAWETQGALRDRTAEQLGASDVGVVMWRQLVKEQIERVKRGEEPMCVVRDAEEYPIIPLTRAALVASVK